MGCSSSKDFVDCCMFDLFKVKGDDKKKFYDIDSVVSEVFEWVDDKIVRCVYCVFEV